MPIPKHSWLLVAGLALAGCPDDPPREEPARNVASTTAAAPKPSSTAGPARESGPKLSKPKAYKATEAQALGTVPEGVGVAVGKTAPDFELPAHAKGNVTLDGLLAKGEAILVFYRGGW